MLNAVVTYNMLEPQKEELIRACEGRCVLRFMLSKDELAQAAGELDAILGPAPVNAEFYANARKLKWLQTESAGVDNYIPFIKNIPGATLTNSSGAYGRGISEYLLTYTLVIMKKMREYYDAQRRHEWVSYGRVQTIEGADVTVVGLGNLGGNFARKMHLLGARVRGVDQFIKEKPEYIDELFRLDNMDEGLAGADIIALCLPNTPLTRGLMTRERIFAMKPGAILMNVGRGFALDQDALIDALKEKRIFAGLDVTTPEPLPQDSPLWDLENLVLTPHVSGGPSSIYAPVFISDIFVRNMKAFLDGRPLENVVDLELGF